MEENLRLQCSNSQRHPLLVVQQVGTKRLLTLGHPNNFSLDSTHTHISIPVVSHYNTNIVRKDFSNREILQLFVNCLLLYQEESIDAFGLFCSTVASVLLYLWGFEAFLALFEVVVGSAGGVY